MFHNHSVVVISGVCLDDNEVGATPDTKLEVMWCNEAWSSVRGVPLCSKKGIK